jgi:astacin
MNTKHGIKLIGLLLCASLGQFAPAVLAQSPDPFAPKPHVPVGCQLVEGDITIPAPVGPFAAAATFGGWQVTFWPGATVPYEFDGNVSAANQAAMRAAMDIVESVCAVRFHPKEWWEPFWIHVQNSTGNSSPVGRQPWPFNNVNIISWDSPYIIVHELMHTLGIFHEQSHPIRDIFVRINTQNIESGKESNFDRHDEASFYGGYDFDSVMHYGQFAFSANGLPTITVLPPFDTVWQTRIGQRSHLSAADARILSFLYAYSNWRFVNGSYSGLFENGTFFEPDKSYARGESEVATGGTLWIQRGTYAAVGSHTKPMTLQAPLGGVTLR